MTDLLNNEEIMISIYQSVVIMLIMHDRIYIILNYDLNGEKKPLKLIKSYLAIIHGPTLWIYKN